MRMSKERRREQLIAAARQEVLRSGLTAVKMTDIADAAGVNVALLYQHFGSREELLETAVIEPLRDAVEDLRETGTALALTTPAASREGTLRFQREVMSIFRDLVIPIGTVCFSDPSLGSAFYREHIAPLIETIVDVSASNLPAWRNREVRPHTLVHMLIGTCWSLSMEHAFTDREIDLDRATDEVFTVLMRAVTEP